jgi:FkbM family methyltransferase
MRHRIAQLRTLGCERVAPAGLLFWKYPEIYLPYFPMDLPHKVLSENASVRKAFGIFADEHSREEFLGQLRFRMLMDFDFMGAPHGSNNYFDTGLFELLPNEVFVDCGAFDGDTVEAFVRHRNESFARVIAYEPDAVNIRKLENRLADLPASMRSKIAVLPYALGSEPGYVVFPSIGSDQSRIGDGDSQVQVVTLDDSLEGSCPTFLKFDIEGAEIAALRGARHVIARHRPVLAVSVYHEQSHLWKIPLLLHELCAEYSFYLRPLGAEGWDLLCFAIPRERCLLG